MLPLHSVFHKILNDMRKSGFRVESKFCCIIVLPLVFLFSVVRFFEKRKPRVSFSGSPSCFQTKQKNSFHIAMQKTYIVNPSIIR